MSLELGEAQRASLITIFHLETLSSMEQSQVLAEIGETILKRALKAALDRLTPEERAELNERIAQGADSEQVGAYLATALPDYTDIFLQTTLAYREEFEQTLHRTQENG